MTTYSQSLALYNECKSNGVVFDLEGGRVRAKRPAHALPPGLWGRLSDALGATLPEEARSGLDTHRAMAAMVRASSVAERELLTLPVAAWHGLPLPSTLTATRQGVIWVATTSRAVYESTKVPAFVALELEAVGLAVEEGRAAGPDLDRWLDAKRRGQLRLTPAIVGVLNAARTPALSFGELLDGLGAELVAVEVHERSSKK